MTRMAPRAFGVAVLLIGLLVFDASDASVLQRLVVPAALTLGAWLLVQNAVPVMLAVCVIAALHSDTASSDLISSRVLPCISAIAGITLLTLAAGRFRARIRDTRTARWANRGEQPRPPFSVYAPFFLL